MAQALWYVRKHDKIYGPYPKPQIQEYLILGRITRRHEISLDKEQWLSIAESGQFPESAAPVGVPAGDTEEEGAWLAEREEARRRWLDERLYDEAQPGIEPRNREGDGMNALRHDHRVTQELIRAEQSRRPAMWLGLAALGIVTALAAGVWLGQGEGTVQVKAPVAAVNCQAMGEGVNWTACDKRGAQLLNANLKSANLGRVRLDDADLSGADLTYAYLVGASLRAANLEGTKLLGADLNASDLTGANLSGADLSYANFAGARTEGVRWVGARLDKAVWVDGRTCAEGSVGACR